MTTRGACATTFAAVEFQMDQKDMTTLKNKPWHYIFDLRSWVKDERKAYFSEAGTVFTLDKVSMLYLKRITAEEYWEERGSDERQ